MYTSSFMYKSLKRNCFSNCCAWWLNYVGLDILRREEWCITGVIIHRFVWRSKDCDLHSNIISSAFAREGDFNLFEPKGWAIYNSFRRACMSEWWVKLYQLNYSCWSARDCDIFKDRKSVSLHYVTAIDWWWTLYFPYWVIISLNHNTNLICIRNINCMWRKNHID